MKIYTNYIDKYINLIINLLFIISVCFPYIQIVQTESYNQPYSLILGLIILTLNYKYTIRIFKKKLFFSLLLLLLFSIIIYFITSYPYTNPLDFKYLITYLTLPIISAATYIILNDNKSQIVKILILSSLIWLLIGLIQQFFSPTFLTFLIGQWKEVSEDSVLSGRGITNLAPEPTHYGFHILLMATSLYYLRTKSIYILLCILQSILLARSSSGLLTIFLGILFFFLFSKSTLKKYIIIFFGIIFSILFYKYVSGLDTENVNIRVLSLLHVFFEAPLEILKVDASMNARIGGIYYSFKLIVTDFFIPHGLSQTTWLKYNNYILTNSDWLLMLSESQPPSGFGTILYQCGFLSFYALYKIITTILKTKSIQLYDWLKYTALFVVLSQFTLATPIFCFIIGIAEYNSNEDAK